MHKNTRDISGMTFHSLKAISKSENIGLKVAWVFECECGVRKKIISTNVISGKTKSCGCLRVKHGNSSRPEYLVWYSMVDRCTNKNNKFWHRYGGRGVSIDSGWMSFDGFIADMGWRPTKKHQLDRIDNNSGYSKINCRWVEAVDNARNRSDSKYWFVDGVRYESMREAARAKGVAHSTIKVWCNNNINGCYSERKYK